MLASTFSSRRHSLLIAGASVGLLAFGIALAGGCSNSSGGGAASGDDCIDTLTSVSNTEYCVETTAETDCSLVSEAFEYQACGVPLKPPTGDLSRVDDVEEFAGSGAPDLSCFNASTYPAPPGASELVTMSGIVKIFSNGCESNDVSIEIYEVQRGGSPENEGALGNLVGTSLLTPSDCETEGVATEDEECGTRYECTFSYTGVPTETELVVKTDGADWAPLYQYNIYIPNDEVVDGVWENDIRALAQDDYTLIPQVAIGGPVTPGNGVVAGEIHDCGNVRLQNAVADINKSKAVVTYFTNNEERPLPDTTASSSSKLSLYSAMDVSPGAVTVAAAGSVGGEVTSLGHMTVQVFPDSVTSVTFRGLRPWQVPTN